MRKLLFVIAAVAVVLSSCSGNGNVQEDEASGRANFECVDTVIPDGGFAIVRYKIVDGCRWLLFIDNFGLSTEHSPKCRNPECPYRNGIVQHDTVYVCKE
jgi:hypothetical protein